MALKKDNKLDDWWKKHGGQQNRYNPKERAYTKAQELIDTIRYEINDLWATIGGLEGLEELLAELEELEDNLNEIT